MAGCAAWPTPEGASTAVWRIRAVSVIPENRQGMALCMVRVGPTIEGTAVADASDHLAGVLGVAT